MKGTPAIYLDRIVDKKYFRTFVYGADGEKKLVESWDEFEVAMQSGIWFATLQNVELSNVLADEVKVLHQEIVKEKPKRSSKRNKVIEEDGYVIEVI